MTTKKLTKQEMQEEVNNMEYDGKMEKHGLYQGKIYKSDPLGKSLDWFIGEWNRQAKVINKKEKEKLLSWARGE